MSRVPSAVLRNKGVPIEVAELDGDKILRNDDESVRVTNIWIRFDSNAMADLEEAYGSLEAFDEAVNKTPTTCIRRALSIAWGVSPRTAGLMMLDGHQDDYANAIAVALALANGVDPQAASDLFETGTRAVREARKLRSETVREIQAKYMAADVPNISTIPTDPDVPEPAVSPGTNGGPTGSVTATPPTPVSSGV